MKDESVQYRGVYGYFVDNVVVYVGSSTLGLEQLEQNHRTWKSRFGESGRTKFRSVITENEDYKSGEFRWLVKPALRTRLDVESLEGQLIRSLKTPLNVDKDPVKSSIKYGRI